MASDGRRASETGGGMGVVNLCACGCGQPAGRRYISGHHSRKYWRCTVPGCASPHWGKGLCREHLKETTRVACAGCGRLHDPRSALCLSCGHSGPLHWAWRGTDLRELFWSQVDQSAGFDGCWIWRGDPWFGYGRFRAEGKYWLAHRYAFRLEHGSLPAHIDLHHRCRTPLCVNTNHLVFMTRSAHSRKHALEQHHGGIGYH